MRLTIPMFCLLAVLWGGCSKSDPVEKAKKLEIGPAMLIFEADGRVKRRDTDEVYSGSVVQRNQDGKTISVANYKDGRQNGLTRIWHPSGGKQSEAEWKNGQPHGAYVEWFLNGHKKIEGRYENGVPVGIFREWDQEGKHEWEREMVDGKPGQRTIVHNADLKLSEQERKYLWDTEHHGTLMRKFGFKPIAEALKARKVSALADIMTEDFTGWVPNNDKGVSRDLGTASASRLEVDIDKLKQITRTEFNNWLIKELSAFSSDLNIKLHLMTFAPLKRKTINGTWNGRVKLRAWGKSLSGGHEELTLYMDWKLNFPNEEILKTGGWLSECRIIKRKRASAKQFLMKDVASEVGLPVEKIHDNWKHGPDKTDTNTGGVFACDYNQDGITDLLVTDKLPGPRMPSLIRQYLFRGTSDGRMVDVTDEVGLRGTYIHTAFFADLDGDGWEDLVADHGRIFRNHSGQSFKEVNTNLAAAGDLVKHGDGAGTAFADYDNDGKVDLYIFRNDVNRLEGTWVDGKIGPGAANQLLRNLGDWQFEDVTSATGADGGRRSTFTSVWLDANNDNRPDLYVINEYGNGVLLINQGNGQRFKEMELMDRAADFGSMGLTAGDFNNDGNIDLYVASMYSKSGSRVIGNLRPDAYDATTMRKLQRMVAGSQLYRNLGGMKFEPVGKKFDVVAVGWAYGPTLTDLDNDGFLDIHATTGFISRTREKPDG